MNPVALIELLEEGVILFRRVLDAYNKYEKISDTVAELQNYVRDNARSHYSVDGEEVYFFILGRETVKRVFPQSRVPQDAIDQLVLVSLYQAVESRSSLDARSCLVDFALALGQTFQTAYDDFNQLCARYLDGRGVSYSLEDPVLSFIQNVNRVVPEPTSGILQSLGVDPKIWKVIVDATLSGSVGKPWLAKVDKMASKHLKPHKTQTFLGLIMRGAESVSQTAATSVPILEGVDSFGLSLNLLTRPKPMQFKREPFLDVRGITAQMVTSTSIRTMKSRGYVLLSDGEWAHSSEVTYEESPLDKNKKIPVRRVRVAGVFAEASEESMSNQGRTLNRVGSTILNYSKKKTKRVVSEAHHDIEATILARLAKLKNKQKL